MKCNSQNSFNSSPNSPDVRRKCTKNTRIVDILISTFFEVFTLIECKSKNVNKIANTYFKNFCLEEMMREIHCCLIKIILI